MTIGVGFLCGDGLVIGSDTQITVEGSHKFYESKIYEHRDPSWTVIMNCAGWPDVMRDFWTEFLEKMKSSPQSPQTCSAIRRAIKEVLQDVPNIEELSILGALCIPNKEWSMVVVSGKNVGDSQEPCEFIGCGDASMLRYLRSIICHPQAPSYSYTCQQARILTAYLVYCAKRYVDGCGGDTHLRILHPNGYWDTENGFTSFEDRVRSIEERLAIASSLSFDLRTKETVLTDNWRVLAELIMQTVPKL